MKNQEVTSTSTTNEILSFEDFCNRLPLNEYWTTESRKEAYILYKKNPENYFKS